MTWIKMETNLNEKPEVIAIANKLGLSRFDVVGRLHRLWSWFDSHTENGHAVSVTETFLDELVCRDGFADALRQVDWLQARKGSLVIPNFARHNGHSAKKRALSTERKRRSRHPSPSDEPQLKTSRIQRDISVTREEKRRIKKNIKKKPARKLAVTPEQVGCVYEAYPVKVGKPKAFKAIEKAIAKHGYDHVLLRTRRFAEIRNGSKEFVPHPSTWFNQERYNDDSSTWLPYEPNKGCSEAQVGSQNGGNWSSPPTRPETEEEAVERQLKRLAGEQSFSKADCKLAEKFVQDAKELGLEADVAEFLESIQTKLKEGYDEFSRREP